LYRQANRLAKAIKNAGIQANFIGKYINVPEQCQYSIRLANSITIAIYLLLSIVLFCTEYHLKEIMSQSITLAELLRDSAYKLTQFKP
jgi:hypothetical protein